jgi:hypothetical protein
MHKERSWFIRRITLLLIKELKHLGFKSSDIIRDRQQLPTDNMYCNWLIDLEWRFKNRLLITDITGPKVGPNIRYRY